MYDSNLSKILNFPNDIDFYCSFSGEITEIEKDKYEIECLDISFTLTNVIDKDNREEFEVDTNIKEHFDVFGRMVYIIKKVIKKTK